MKAILALLLGVPFVWIPQYSWDHEFTTLTFNEKDPKQLWQDWMAHHDRKYANLEEESYRYSLWSAKMQEIIQSNDEDRSYKLRMNRFGDLTSDEFKLEVHGHTGSCLDVPVLESLVDPTHIVDWQAVWIVWIGRQAVM